MKDPASNFPPSSPEKRQGLILLPPCTKDSNAYLKNLQATLAKDFDLYDVGDIRKQPWLLLTKVHIVYLNWIENDPGWRPFLQLLLLKLLGIRIVWTLHNKTPHHKTRPGWAAFFMQTLMRLSDAIVIHCRDSQKILSPSCHHKTHYLPHGNYIGNYPPPRVDLRGKFNIPPDQLVLLSLGSLKRYKNVELLLEAFQTLPAPDIHLIVAGAPESDAYARQLEQLVHPRIHLDLRHIPDDEISAFFEVADVFVSPLDLRSSLNSGALILAFSYGKTVIAPRIGTLKDYAGQPDFFYAYDYETSEEHFSALRTAIQQAYNDWKTRPEQLREWGRTALAHMRTENDWEALRPTLVQICCGRAPSA